MQRETGNPAVILKAKFLFTVYCGSSKGLSWNGQPVPTWSEIADRARQAAIDAGREISLDGIEPGSVNDHWYTVALSIAPNAPMGDGLTALQVPSGDALTAQLEYTYDCNAEKIAALHRYFE